MTKIFSKTNKIYDSARDELVLDYLGFGAAAFSKIGNRQFVNPPYSIYMNMINHNNPLAFQAKVDPQSESWRRFAHELYNLRINTHIISQMPKSVKFVYKLLQSSRYVRDNTITPKGRFFVHDLTKTVVENLPFPVNNPKAISNYPEYHALLIQSQKDIQVENTHKSIGL